MVETYYAGAYWLARPESAEACARRAESFFRLLGRCDAAWNRWHETAPSFAEASKHPVVTDAETFTRMFGRKRNRVGDGFQFWLWAGETPEETTRVDAGCGASTPHVISNCVLTPPQRGHVAERVLSASVLADVVRAMALAWEPEWAVATSQQHQEQAYGEADPDTFTGWAMYFSRQRGTVPPLPAPVHIEPVEDKGTLVILTSERFTVSNPEHVALAARVQELLDRAGLLRPLQPFGTEDPGLLR
jgi:hypothetical protein